MTGNLTSPEFKLILVNKVNNSIGFGCHGKSGLPQEFNGNLQQIVNNLDRNGYIDWKLFVTCCVLY